VTSCLDAGILLAAQCSNSSITALETYMMGALHPTPNDQPPRPNPHWTHLIIDEVCILPHPFHAAEFNKD